MNAFAGKVYVSDQAAWMVAGNENRRRRRNNDSDRVEVVAIKGGFVIVEMAA